MRGCDLVLHPVESGADCHGLDLAPPVHTLVVRPGLAQGLIQPPLELLELVSKTPTCRQHHLDPHHHIEVAL